MPAICNVCNRADRAAIEKALAEGASLNHVARSFSLPRASLQRHAHRHIPTPAAAAGAAPTTAPTHKPKLKPRPTQPKSAHPKLLQRLELCFRASSRLLQDHGELDPYIAIQAIARIESQCRLLYRLDPQGALEKPGPDIAQIHQLIEHALQPYPQARAALVQALSEIRQASLHHQADTQSETEAHPHA